MIKIHRVNFAILSLLLCTPVYSQVSPDGSISSAIETAILAAGKSNILPQAIIWLSSFMGLQLIITNIGLFKSGADIEAIFGKLIGSLMWFGVCIYLLKNGPDFIDSVGTGILKKFLPDWITPGYFIAAITGIVGVLLATIGLTGIMVFGNGHPLIALIASVLLFIVIGVGLGLAIKIFMLKLELGLILLLAPLSFSFLGLNALKDQGIAPFKSLISLCYRIILLGVICSAFKEVITTTYSALNGIEWGVNPIVWIDKVQILIAAFFSFPILGYLAFKSDSIAASLASGTTNMGTADVAAAAAMGAAAGSAVASGAAALTGGAPVPSMSSILGKMMGGGPSVSNASTQGSGRVGGPGNPLVPSLSLKPDPLPDAGAGGDTPVAAGPGGAPRAPAGEFVAGPSDDKKAYDAQQALTSSSGKSAGIGGSDSGGGDGALAQTLKAIEGHLAPKSASFGDKIGAVNQHVAKESASTGVSINTHHAD